MVPPGGTRDDGAAECDSNEGCRPNRSCEKGRCVLPPEDECGRNADCSQSEQCKEHRCRSRRQDDAHSESPRLGVEEPETSSFEENPVDDPLKPREPSRALDVLRAMLGASLQGGPDVFVFPRDTVGADSYVAESLLFGVRAGILFDNLMLAFELRPVTRVLDFAPEGNVKAFEFELLVGRYLHLSGPVYWPLVGGQGVSAYVGDADVPIMLISRVDLLGASILLGDQALLDVHLPSLRANYTLEDPRFIAFGALVGATLSWTPKI